MYERSIKLSIGSKIDNMTLLLKAIQAVCSTVVNDALVLYNIELCLNEAVVNVINHAYERKLGNIVEITVDLDDHQVAFQIVDSGGKAFSPVLKEDIDNPSNDVTTWSESGQGLSLIYRLMDEVNFSNHEGKNILTMKKNLAK